MNFDLSIIYTRPDGSYVINKGMYHVPNEGEWAELWAQVAAYAKEHPEVVMPEPTPEELAAREFAKLTPEEQEAAELAQAKAERAALVEKATVTVDGMTFDADETSQNRLSRGITAALALGLGPDETTEWTLADNSSAQVTVQQMARALLAAGQYQTSVWRMPYES